MNKFLLLILIIFVIIICGYAYYNSQKTTECWWGVLYPSLSFIGFEENKSEKTEFSSVDRNYLFIEKENDSIKIKIAIIEWFNKYFKR